MTTTDDTTTDQMTDTGTTDGTTTTTTTDGTDTAAELAKWKELARKNEDRAKANAAAVKELEALKRTSMTEQEKAVDLAKAEGRTEGLREAGVRLAEAAIRVAAAGRSVDIDALLEGIDASKFIDGNGEPDTKAINTWVDRVAPADDGTKPPPKRDLGVGARGGQQQSNGDPAQEFAKFIGAQLNS